MRQGGAPHSYRHVASAITEEDESDFLNELIRSVLQKGEIVRASGIFGVENDLTASPMGSPTATSPITLPILTLDQWIACREEVINKASRGNRRRIQPSTQQLQML